MAELYKYTCPSCGANIDPTGAGKVLTCSFCGSVFDRTDILNSYDKMTADKNAKLVKKYKADLMTYKGMQASALRIADEVTELTNIPTDLPKWAQLLLPIQVLAIMFALSVIVMFRDNSTALTFLMIPFLFIILALLIANNKKKKLVRESDEVRMKLKNKLLELNNARAELEEYEKNFDIKIIPQEHRSYESLDYMAELLGSYQAIKLGDAFRLCSERDHFKRMEDLQKQQVDIQQKQLELMDQLADYDFDDTYDDDDFTLHETLKAFGGKQ